MQRRHVDDATRSAVRLHVIHGAGGRAEQFDPLLDRITAAAPWSAVSFDWLGHGKSERPDGWDLYAADELYADVERVYQQHRTAGTNIVLAHSYGTAMAMRLAAEKDNDVAAVVLLGPLTWEPPAAAGNPGFYLPCFVLEWIRPMIAKSFADAVWHPNTDRELVEREAAISSKNPFYVFKPMSRQMQAAPKEAFAALDVPALVVAGRTDKVTPVGDAEKVHGALGHLGDKAKLLVMEEAGHQIMLEQPDLLWKEMQAFLVGNKVVVL